MRMYRDDIGAIVVTDIIEYNKYKREVAYKSEIISLREEIANLQSFVYELVKLNQKPKDVYHE